VVVVVAVLVLVVVVVVEVDQLKVDTVCCCRSRCTQKACGLPTSTVLPTRPTYKANFQKPEL